MMKQVLQFLVITFSVMIAGYILQSGISVNSFWAALVFALVLGLINTFIKPFMLLFTLPLTIMTLGLFTFVINGIAVALAAYIVPGVVVASFWYAILFSIVISIVSWAIDSILGIKENNI